MTSLKRSPIKYTHTYAASSVGHLAKAQMMENNTGRIIGSTSRGFFILSTGQRVMFVSYEKERGPLTVNLSDPPIQPLPVFVGQDVLLYGDGIVIDNLETHCLLEPDALWMPPNPPADIRPLSVIDATMRELVTHIQDTRRGVGFAPLLAFIFDLSARPTVPITLQPTIVNVILLKQQLFTRPFLESLPQIKELMGLGRGLTPSGDDFICGMLLAVNRLPKRPHYQPQLDDFIEQIVELAFAKTTALSANLIRAAAQGSADERLIDAIDGLFNGKLTPTQILAGLEAYGSSSGLDAFAGVGLVVQSMQEVLKKDARRL